MFEYFKKGLPKSKENEYKSVVEKAVSNAESRKEIYNSIVSDADSLDKNKTHDDTLADDLAQQRIMHGYDQLQKLQDMDRAGTEFQEEYQKVIEKLDQELSTIERKFFALNDLVAQEDGLMERKEQLVSKETLTERQFILLQKIEARLLRLRQSQGNKMLEEDYADLEDKYDLLQKEVELLRNILEPRNPHLN